MSAAKTRLRIEMTLAKAIERNGLSTGQIRRRDAKAASPLVCGCGRSGGTLYAIRTEDQDRPNYRHKECGK